MPNGEATETTEVLEGTVSVPVRALVDAVAGMDAVTSVLIYLNGGQAEGVATIPQRIAWELYGAVFGEDRPEQDETDPVYVETYARCDERAAELLLEVCGEAREEAARYANSASDKRECGHVSPTRRPAGAALNGNDRQRLAELVTQAQTQAERLEGVLRRIRELPLRDEPHEEVGDHGAAAT